MVNTVVCKKEGCCGNRFKISVQRLRIVLICTECRNIEKLNKEVNSNIPTICSKCTGEIFRVSRLVEENKLFFECVCCGHTFTFTPKEYAESNN